MKSWRTSLWMFCVGLAFALQARGATRVDLVIDEPAPERSVAWPITTGVPFPRGRLVRAEQCRLIDDTGREQPLQARVAATWDAAKSSIRWLTIDFIAEPGRKYALEFGPDVVRTALPTRLKAVDDQPIRIDTGVLVAELSRQGPSALKSLAVDLDRDGRIEDEERALTGPADGDHYYVDQDGKRSSSAGDGAERRIVVETAGPVRACIRVDGYYTGAKGERIVRSRTRYHFFAGLGLIKVVDEFGIVGSSRDTRFQDIGFALQLSPTVGARAVRVDASGEPGSQIVTIPWNSETRSIAAAQTTYRHFGNPEYHAAVVETHPEGQRIHRQTDRMGEWFQVADGKTAITGSLPWFWQQFPKEWEATSDRLVLHLWSPRGGELDFGREGIARFFGTEGSRYLLDWKGVGAPRTPIENFFYNAGRDALARGEADGKGTNKHHEFWLHVAPAAKTEEGAQYGALAARPPLCLASGRWNSSTDVFGPLESRPNAWPEEAIVDRLFGLERYAQDAFGDYGWWVFGSGPHYSYQWDAAAQRHYADPRRFEFHTYQRETQLWWCYLRSGERKFFDWALPSENHWIDVAVAHVPTHFHCEWRGGAKLPRDLHWPAGDWAIDTSMHYVRHHDTGEAWLRGASQFWATYHRTLETTTLAYYLTGDERFNDVIEFWRAYWSDLAGKTSASPDWAPWHREQAWFELAETVERPKNWAEMIRDYAPFTSGSRHQQTLFFNLSTLYEHTWDPKIGQALDEYANAFLDPKHPIGVWRSQDNSEPAHADVPWLAHYWLPALWKYGRATRDPQISTVLSQYFDAMYWADPFREDVGVYSNVQLGYAWYFTRDPRHLRPVLEELTDLRRYAEPLAGPEALGERIYNPYAPVKSLTAVPRLLWALEDAARNDVSIPPPAPLEPQRTTIALEKRPDIPLIATLWGFDRGPVVRRSDGRIASEAKIVTTERVTHLQPFDRTLPHHRVYVHELTLPADAPAKFYFIEPKLELAVLRLTGSDAVLWNAAQPVALRDGDSCWLQPSSNELLKVESALPSKLQVFEADGTPLSAKLTGNVAVYHREAGNAPKPVRFVNSGTATLWFRLVDLPPSECWLASRPETLDRFTKGGLIPPLPQTSVEFDPSATFVPGRFGAGLLVVPGRTLHLPDRVTIEGRNVPLVDSRQGTIEFWVKRLWDDRLAVRRQDTFLTNGIVQAACPWKLPLGEWAHVAVVWRPHPRDDLVTLVHAYVDGVDPANYRSLFWAGYSVQPLKFGSKGQDLGEFISQAVPGAAFAIDELRISRTPRYADMTINFGGQHTANPVHFDPPNKSLVADAATTLLFHFDGDLIDARRPEGQRIEGRLLPK